MSNYFYISEVYSADVDAEKHICDAFRHHELGEVERIEFIPIEKNKEYFEEGCTHAKVYLADTNFSSVLFERDTIRRELNYRKEYFLSYTDNDNDNVYRLVRELDEDMPETYLLEETPEKQQLQEALIRIENLEQVVHELIGGLYNQITQSETMTRFSDILLNKNESGEFKDTSKWGVFPTTRQGDYLERKLKIAEKKIEEIRLSLIPDLATEEQEEYEYDLV